MKKLIKNPFIQGGIWMTIANFVIGFFNYIFNVFAARLLGPEGYGNITTLFSYLAVLTIPLGAISNVLIQKIGASSRAFEFSVGIEKWTYKKIRKWWFILLLPLLLTPFMPALTNLHPIAAYTIIPLVLISILTTLYDGILTGLHLFFWSSVIGIFVVALKLGGLGIAYVSGMPLLSIVVLYNISILIKIAGSKMLLLKSAQKKIEHHIPIIEKRIITVLTDRQMLLTIGSLVAVTLLQNLDMIYAKKILSADHAGLFAAWSLLAKIITYIFGPLIAISYVFFSNKKDEMYHRIFLIVGLLLLVVVGVASNLGYGYFDKFILTSLFGEKFFSLKPFVEWAALFGSGYLIMIFLNTYFMAKGSRATLILPCTLPIYIGALFFYVKDIGSLIFLDTVFIFFVLTLYLIPLFKDRFMRLLR